MRLGLVQAALGGIVVLVTTTLNRVMVVELALPATIPGALVALHFAVQLVRPRVGHGSDAARRSPWIIAGMTLSGASAVAAVALAALVATTPLLAIALMALAFVGLGIGIGMAGTPLLALLAEQVSADRRAGAAAVAWLMMISGFVVVAGATSVVLDPFSFGRFTIVAAVVAVGALAVTAAALAGIETRRAAAPAAAPAPFGEALRDVLAVPELRRFSVFVLLAMLAFSAQEIILEPFVGTVFGLTPGESTRIAGVQNAGMLAGMCAAGLLARRFGSLAGWARWGCAASAASFVALAFSPLLGGAGTLTVIIAVLGASNGAFAIGALGSMMRLAVDARGGTGLRMGLFGAAQAVAYGAGGLAGATLSDIARWVFGTPALGYGAVFLVEAGLFAAAAVLAARLTSPRRAPVSTPPFATLAGAR